MLTPMTTWTEFVQRGIDRKGWRASDLADTAGMSRSTVSRWLTGGATSVSVPKVAATCEALGLSLLAGLVAAGHIPEGEVGLRNVAPDVGLLSRRELVTEVNARLKRAERAEPVNLRHLRFTAANGIDSDTLAGLDADELAEVRRFAEDVAKRRDDKS